jgi:hypothetical protein
MAKVRKVELLMHSGRLLIPIFLLAGTANVVFAQTPALDAGAVPQIELSTIQKDAIYQSVTNTQKNNAAPSGFRVTPGAVMPNGIPLSPVPGTIADLIPQTKGLEVAVVEGQVVLAEPSNKQIVAVIVEGPQR